MGQAKIKATMSGEKTVMLVEFPHTSTITPGQAGAIYKWFGQNFDELKQGEVQSRAAMSPEILDHSPTVESLQYGTSLGFFDADAARKFAAFAKDAGIIENGSAFSAQLESEAIRFHQMGGPATTV